MGYSIKSKIHWLENGYLDSFAEFAYTSPCLYLNYKSWEGESMYMLAHIVGYSGYPYGLDAIVVLIGSEYSSFDAWGIRGTLLYVVHGEYGKKSR